MENKDEYIIELQKELIERLMKEIDEKDHVEYDLKMTVKRLSREVNNYR